MEKPQIFLSLILIVSGLILISDVSLSKITGNIIGGKPVIGFSFVGFLFLILGIVLFFISHEGKLERNLAQEIRKSGKVIDKPKELIHIATEMGYTFGKNVKEGMEVYNGEKRITTIPLHKVTWVTARNILKDLAEGNSGYGKRNY